MYDNVYFAVTNIFYNFNIIVWALFDQFLPLSKKHLPSYHRLIPFIYKEQRQKENFSFTRFTLWSIYAISSAFVAFYTGFYSFQSAGERNLNRDEDLWALCLISYTIYVVVININMLLYTMHFTWVITLFYIVNILAFFPLSVVMNNYAPKSYQYLSTWESLFQLNFWISVLIGSALILTPLFIYKKCKVLFWPYKSDILRQFYKKMSVKENRISVVQKQMK